MFHSWAPSGAAGDRLSLPVLQAARRAGGGRGQLPAVRGAVRRRTRGQRIGLDAAADDPEHDPAELRHHPVPDQREVCSRRRIRAGRGRLDLFLPASTAVDRPDRDADRPALVPRPGSA